jgi:hypothetical protein
MVKCPICQKQFERRGIAGHIRLAHDKAGKELHEAVDDAEPVSVHTLVVLQDRLNELDRIQAQKKVIQESLKSQRHRGILEGGLLKGPVAVYYEEAIQALYLGLGQKEADLVEQIRKLSKDYHNALKTEHPAEPESKKSWWRSL